MQIYPILVNYIKKKHTHTTDSNISNSIDLLDAAMHKYPNVQNYYTYTIRRKKAQYKTYLQQVGFHFPTNQAKTVKFLNLLLSNLPFNETTANMNHFNGRKLQTSVC